MKKLLASLVFMALFTSMLASNKKVITLSFDPKDYPVTLDKQGAAIFNSSVRPLIFKEEPHMPGIPYVPVTILVASLAYVQVSNLTGTNVQSVNLPMTDGLQNATITGLSAGVNVITYVVDGVIQDTIQIYM